MAKFGKVSEVFDFLFDLLRRGLMWHITIDGRFDWRWSDQVFLPGVATRVQYLQADFTAFLVHGIGNHFMIGDLLSLFKERNGIIGQAIFAGHKPAGNNQGNTTARAFGVKCSHALVTIGNIFQAGMH